jgi:hypothetical protein
MIEVNSTMAKSNHLSENEPERQKREQDMDKTLADSFPSSDPPSTIPDPMTDEPAKQAANERAESPEEPAQGIAGKADRAFRTTAKAIWIGQALKSIYSRSKVQFVKSPCSLQQSRPPPVFYSAAAWELA